MGKRKSKKRKLDSISHDNDDNATPDNKCARPFPSEDEEGSLGFQGEKARIDPTSGLRTAFPGLEDDDSGELFYGPASDGLEYLRMVRSEAKGVPNLLVAPKDTEEAVNEELYNSGYGDMRGYYQDGAYTALPVADFATPDDTVDEGVEVTEEEEREAGHDPQDVYRKSLHLRYRLLRANLRIPPPRAALVALDENHPISFSEIPGNLSKRSSKWRYIFRNIDPLPGQVAAMDQQTVLRLIRFSTYGFLRRNRNIRPTVARWIWVLLGKLEEVGCLSSEEVGVVRDLGKTAVSVLVGIGGASEDDEQKEHGEDPEGERPTRSGEGSLGNEAEFTEEAKAETALTEAAKSSLEREDRAVSLPGEEPSTGKVEDPSDEDVEEGEIRDGVVPDCRTSPKHEEVVLDIPANSTKCGDEDFKAAKQRLLARLPTPSAPADPNEEEPFPSPNTTATLDMIITIVGEHYGQRDLLEFREVWG